jgi:TPR repeat protein
VSYVEALEWMERAHEAEHGGDRLYNLLAYFDTRDGTPMADLVRAAREGWERAGPDMAEASAWDEFDALWSRRKEASDG